MMENSSALQTIKFVFFTLLISLLSYNSNAGVWPRAEGSGYSQLSFTTKTFQNRYMGGYADTEKFELRRAVTQSSISFYGEYGLSEKITLIAMVPYSIVSTANEINIDVANPFTDTLNSGSISGLGNINISIKYPIKQDDLHISLQLSTEMNTSLYDHSTGLRTGYDAWTFTPSILVGKGYSNKYFTIEAGPFIRTNDYYHGVFANAEYGWTPNKKTYLMGVANGIFKVIDGKHDDENSKHTATYIDNQGYLAIGAKIYQKINDHFSVNVTFFSGFAVINQGDNPGGLFVGLAYEW